MAQTFGKTWWGSEWLKALTHIDYANRIPRGARYARNGAVQSIEVKGNVIYARVSGSRPTPYKVIICVPTFSEKDIDRLIDRLMQQPVLISKLLNRELDPGILLVAKQLGLQVFPHRWSDLQMKCSCPDWAVPCKHLAAVIYMMSREIDNDPFLVFSMHGVDLTAELRKHGVGIDGVAVTGVPMIASLLTVQKSVEPTGQDILRVDCSGLTDLTAALPGLLPKNPPFYPKGDFQHRYQEEIGILAHKAQSILLGKTLPDFTLQKMKGEIQRDMQVKYQVKPNGSLTVTFECLHDNGVKQITDADDFLDALIRLPADYIADYDPSLQAMFQSLFCALHLLANGAVTPRILSTGSSYALWWWPAMLSAEVSQMVGALQQVLPPDLLTLQATAKGKPSQLKNQAEVLLSYLLGRLVATLRSSHADDSPVSQLFFWQKSQSFRDTGEKAIPGSVQAWLARFFLSERQYRPTLLIDEDGANGFTLNVGIERDGSAILLRDILGDKAMESHRFTILKELSLLSALVSGLEEYINTDGRNPIAYNTQQFVPLLFETIPAVRLLGVKVVLPKSLQQIIRPKVSMKLSKRQNDGKTYLRLDQMLQFDWQVALGDTLITSAEFGELVSRASGLIRFKEQYIYVSAEDIERLTKALSSDRPMTATEMLQTALTESFDKARVQLTDEVRQLIRELTAQTDIAVPSGIKATLRPYQERGYSWMYRNAALGFGSIIADDMGLGKTLQVITLLQRMKDDGQLSDKHALIVVPTGLITNWQAELHRFAPGLSVFTYHGSLRTLKPFSAKGANPADILLTTYGVLRSDITKLKKLHWRVAIIDEAQNIKNADTAQSKAVRSIPADTRIAMSGTPVENRLSEFWSIMDFCNQGYLGTVKDFRDKFADPIQRRGDEYVASRFRRITAPFLMRRLKTDKTIISDLPDKVEQNEPAVLTESQAALYHETLQKAMKAIEAVEGTGHESLFKRQGLVLQMILALKQICNHPALFLKNGDHSPELSGKSEMLLSLLESIVESGQKVLVFTQFREMGDMLSEMIAARLGVPPLFLHGGCTIKQRQEMVDRFQQNTRTDHIFLLSLKAAGTGLNLTAASHVIHYDLWWNPAVEAQATDRAYRIGQHQNVVVHRFITQNTFEERIDQMIQEKRHLADLTVATGENWIGKLSNKELRELFG